MNTSDIATKLLSTEVPALLPSIDLVVIDGMDRGARLRVPPTGARIGTSSSAHLRLSDPTVSRIHCEVKLRPSGLRITDTSSTNGTYLEAIRIHDIEVASGVRFRIGGTTIEVVLSGATVTHPISQRARLRELI